MNIGSSNEMTEYGQHEPSGQPNHADEGHSGEGAASALAHLISQSQQQRRQSAEADDAAGSHRS
jgi:hypothetical protein